jgi:hypothetical protein
VITVVVLLVVYMVIGAILTGIMVSVLGLTALGGLRGM